MLSDGFAGFVEARNCEIGRNGGTAQNLLN